MIETQTQLIPTKASPLRLILKAITEHDDELNDFDPDMIDQFMLDSREKIDDYKSLIDRLEVLALESETRAKAWDKRAKGYRSKAKQIERKLIYALQSNDFQKFTGNEWQVRIKYSEKTEPKFKQPADHHAIHAHKFIRTKYEWDLIALKAALRPLPERHDDEMKADHELACELASIVKSPNVEFIPAKEIE
jgi:hypothetical protein